MEFKLDRMAVSVVTHEEGARHDREYWRSLTVKDRLQALEFLRRQFYGADSCSAGIQRVFEIADRQAR